LVLFIGPSRKKEEHHTAKKSVANDVGLALSFAASDTDGAPHFLEERKYLRIDR